MSAFAETSGSFLREQARAPLNLMLLVLVPIFFVIIFATVVGDFAKALGGDLASQSATSISAGWAAAFLCGTLGFFQMSSSREADRRLALAGLGASRVAGARVTSSLALGLIVAVVAYLTLWLRSGVEHPPHALVAILAFALIYIGLGTVIGALVRDPLSGSLLVVLFFAVDAFTTPNMTSEGTFAWTPTRDAASILIDAGMGHESSTADWVGAASAAGAALAIAMIAFWLAARERG